MLVWVGWGQVSKGGLKGGAAGWVSETGWGEVSKGGFKGGSIGERPVFGEFGCLFSFMM